MTCSYLISCSNPLSSSKLNKGGWINSEMVSFQEKKSMCKSSGTMLPFVLLLNRCPCTLRCSDNLNEELHVFRTSEATPLLCLCWDVTSLHTLQAFPCAHPSHIMAWYQWNKRKVPHVFPWLIGVAFCLVAHPLYSLAADGKSPG